MSGSFTQKLLRVSFTSPDGSFQLSVADSPGDTLTMPLRVSALVAWLGMWNLDLRVWGMTRSHMKKMSTFGFPPLVKSGLKVTLEAGDSASGLSEVFSGSIAQAWQDFQQMPETLFHVIAIETLDDSLKPVPPKSYSGPTDVATIMSDIAKDLGVRLENSGVSVMLSDPYLPGDLRTQMDTAARAAGINAVLSNGELAITPRNKARTDHRVVVSPTTGMVGYPASTGSGILVTTLFNPDLRPNAQVSVRDSGIEEANRDDWRIWGLSHILECNVPGGQWFSRFESNPLGEASSPPPMGSGNG